MVRTPIDARPDVRALDQVRVATLSGETLPLGQLARVGFSSAPTEIHRYNRERAVTIDADVKSGYNTDRVTKAVLERLDQMEWPRGYSYVPGGELETRTESFGGLQSALIIALLGIVAILVLEFGNFKSTLIVLTVVPFGIAGGILLLGAHRQHDFLHRHDRLHRADRHRDEELDPAGGLHQSSASRRRAAGRSDRARGRSALPADPADQCDCDRRLAAAGAAELRDVLAARLGDHRRPALLHFRRPHRHAGDLQAHPAGDRSERKRPVVPAKAGTHLGLDSRSRNTETPTCPPSRGGGLFFNAAE